MSFWPRPFLAALVAVAACLIGSGSAFAAGNGPQNFPNPAIADVADRYVGQARPTGWDMPGECIKWVQSWVREAGGHMGSGGPIRAFTSSPAVEVPLSEATRGDVFQISMGDTYSGSPHTGVLLGPRRGDGRFDTVEGNVPAGTGRVVRRTRTLAAPAGHQLRIWRFGRLAAAGSDPIGHLDFAAGSLTGMAVLTGWSFDPDTPAASNQVHVYVDGPAGAGRGHAVDANVSRPDVAAAFPGAGPAHGFSAALPGVAPGVHGVWVYAINTAPGNNPLLWAGSITVPDTPGGSPFGSFDEADGRVGGKARVRGWTVDPDAPTTSTDVHVYVDGPAGTGARGINLGVANSSRPDVPNVHPGVGDNHGFDSVIDGLGPGIHTLWVYAINRAGGGGNPLLRVLTVHIPGPDPIGHVDVASGGVPGFVQLVGWTLDPDTPAASTDVHVYIDGPAGSGKGHAVDADVLRPDVAEVFPGAGAAHGFSVAIPGISPGPHGVWVYGINTGGGNNPLLWTGTVNVPASAPGSPFGSFDSAEGLPNGAASLRGWTVDPDDPDDPTGVHVYVDGPAGSGARGVDLGWANALRPDVPRVHAGVGDRHGVDKRIDGLAPGTHVLWLYAINRAGSGDNPLLGVRRVDVPETPGLVSPPQTPAGRRGLQGVFTAGHKNLSFVGTRKRVSLRRFIRRGLKVRLRVGAPAAIKVRLVLARRTARKAGLRRTTVVAASQLLAERGGTAATRLLPPDRTRLRTAALRGVRVRLMATAADAAGVNARSARALRFVR